MIELVSIEVKNFRSFSEATFSPLRIGEGLTAINGANGLGKSSVATHALVWALYGQAPDGVSVRSLRRQGSEGEVSVKVTFIHDGQTIVVSRELRGKNDTTVAAITLDDVEQTNVSSKTASMWVEKRLGVDAEAFTTAFVIRQKEVDALVRARPAERRALIERLAGIDRMSKALSKAREKARSANTIAKTFSVSVDLDILRDDVESKKNAAEGMSEKYEKAQQELSSLEEGVKKLETEYADLEDKYNDLSTVEQSITLLQEKYNNVNESYEEKKKSAVGADLLPDLQAELSRLAETKEELEETIRNSQESIRFAESKHKDAEKVEQEKSRLENNVAQLKSQLDEATEALALYNEDYESILKHKRVVSAELNSFLGGLEGEKKRLEKAIELLMPSTKDTACPTCNTILDDATQLVSEFELQVEELKNQICEEKEKLTVVNEEISEAEEKSNKVSELINEKDKIETQYTTKKEELNKLETQLELLYEESETAAEEAHKDIDLAEKAKEELSAVIEEGKKTQQALRKAENAVDAEQQLESIMEKRNSIENDLEESQRHYTVLQEFFKEIDMPTVKSILSSKQTELLDKTREFGDIQSMKQTVERDYEDAVNELSLAEKNEEKRKNALAEAETTQAVASSLDEFRRDRIARLAPELSEVASDIISTMTEGRYSSVELDEDFTPILVEAATGLERPVAWLSGGEESAVALALRMAVGEVVSGQNAGLLVLDEVLTAHDKTRRAAVMSAIRSLSGRQIITINHVSEATDMVDLVATVVGDPENGSTIEYSAGGNSTIYEMDSLDEETSSENLDD